VPSHVIIRTIGPDDARRLAAAHGRLSPESVRLRYLAPKPRLSARDLRYLTEVDGIDHVALVAVRGDDIVGVARFVRAAEDPRSAEAAVVITDELQGQGVGTRLGLALADAARARGVERFTATLLRENAAAHALFARVSEHLTSRHDGGIEELVAELPRAA
jgi:GNAT superfamily N-acetyltransferase